MDGNEFISLAGRLVAGATGDEAACRSAISRAYYGAFHVARAFLKELGFQPVRNANVHAFVRNYFAESGHREAYLAAAELSYLQAARNSADYQLDDSRVGTREAAMICVERAHCVVSTLDACRSEAIRQTIRQGIAEYQRKLPRA
jgi:uncharacterized protein (UPF0332 family)